LASCVILPCGFLFEITNKKIAKYINIGFYAAYLAPMLPSMMALTSLIRGHAVDPDFYEGLGYLWLYSVPPLAILVVNILLYKNLEAKNKYI